MVEWFRAPLLWRPVIEITGSTLNSVTLLRPWERRFAIISSAWWILTSSKFLKVNNNHFTIQSEIRNWQLPSGSGSTILCITPPPLSRKWMINMKLSVYLVSDRYLSTKVGVKLGCKRLLTHVPSECIQTNKRQQLAQVVQLLGFLFADDSFPHDHWD